MKPHLPGGAAFRLTTLLKPVCGSAMSALGFAQGSRATGLSQRSDRRRSGPLILAKAAGQSMRISRRGLECFPRAFGNSRDTRRPPFRQRGARSPIQSARQGCLLAACHGRAKPLRHFQNPHRRYLVLVSSPTPAPPRFTPTAKPATRLGPKFKALSSHSSVISCLVELGCYLLSSAPPLASFSPAPSFCFHSPCRKRTRPA